ncbi:unnamed protein product, partial [Ranitomeya imitator]
TTSKPPIQRKTRTGKRIRTRTTSHDYQISGTEDTNNIVYNISSQCLSPTELTVLQKGLTFCPVPKFNTFQLDQELHRFFRNVRLKVHFSNIPDNISTRVTSPESRFSLDSLKLRVRSSFQPPRTHHPVETYIHFVEKDVKRLGDVDTYQLVNSNPSFEIAREIKKFITHYLTLGIIDEKLGNYLLNQHPVLPVLYTLLL